MRRVIFIIVLLLAATAQAQGPTPKIINGVPGSTANYPWVVNYGGCGGALIASQWVLTAAHCQPIVSADTSVILMTDNIVSPSSSAQIIPVSQFIPHPFYNVTTFNNDVALIKLATSVVNPTVVTLMADNQLAANTPVTIMGWGTTVIGNDNMSTNPSSILLMAQQVTLDQASCKVVYGNRLTDNMLCLTDTPGQPNADTCQGDSGGPAVANFNNQWVEIGIVSFGGTQTSAPCGDPNSPGVYAKVANYQAWIKAYVPEAKFYSASNNTDNNCNTVIDPSSYSVYIPCLLYQGVAYQAGLVASANQNWNWPGNIQTTSCPVNPQSCVTVGNDLTLQFPSLLINGESYNATFNYAPAISNTTWTLKNIGKN